MQSDEPTTQILIPSSADDILALKRQLAQLQASVHTLVEWSENARIGTRIFIKICHNIGNLVIWSYKVLAATALLWAAFAAFKSGKLPEIKFPQ